MTARRRSSLAGMPISAYACAPPIRAGDAMSQHQFFKRMPVNQQVAQKLETITFPAPTRGLVLSENESFHAAGRGDRDGQLEADHEGRQPARRLHPLGRTAGDDAGDFGVRIRQRHHSQDVRCQRHQGLRRHHDDAGRGRERADVRQLRRLADGQPGRRLDDCGQRRRRPAAAL